MKITFLGTSGCIPTIERGLPSVLLEYLGEIFLFDCGEGTQRQMRFGKINFMKLDHVFLTHLHADHFLGLGGMIQSMDFLERDRDLNIYGPEGVTETIEKLTNLGTFSLDHFKVKTHEIGPGVVLENKRYTVTAERTIHTKNSLAYCFEEKPHRKFDKPKALALGIPEGRLFSKLQGGEPVEVDGKKFKPEDVLDDPIAGRKIVYTGDTRPSKKIAKFAHGADVLIHEAMYSHEDVEATDDSAHTTTVQAAEIAKAADVGKLYLIHFSQRYTEPAQLEEEARKIFLESHAAYDLLEVPVEKHW